jgi:hypothetical protein
MYKENFNSLYILRADFTIHIVKSNLFVSKSELKNQISAPEISVRKSGVLLHDVFIFASEDLHDQGEQTKRDTF